MILVGEDTLEALQLVLVRAHLGEQRCILLVILSLGLVSRRALRLSLVRFALRAGTLHLRLVAQRRTGGLCPACSAAGSVACSGSVAFAETTAFTHSVALASAASSSPAACSYVACSYVTCSGRAGVAEPSGERWPKGRPCIVAR